jgi:hypothetical protein
MTSILSRLFRAGSSVELPSLAERMAARTSDFQPISLMPYVTPKGDVDFYRPFQYPAAVRPVTEIGPTDRAVWTHGKISCADDICVEASKIASNVEVKAFGINLSARAALLEAARSTEAARCRYIVVTHPAVNRKYNGVNAIVLENTAPSATDSEKALVMTLKDV